jgi:hypothetical protein
MGLTKSPFGVEGRRMRLPRLRLSVRAVMVAIAALALLFAFLPSLLAGPRLISVELVNKTRRPISDFEMSFSGAVVRVKRLSPGESVRWRVWPTTYRRDRQFICETRYRFVREDGTVKQSSPEPRNSNLYLYPPEFEPNVRYELMDFGGKEGLAIQGMLDYKTSKFRKFFRMLFQ